MTAGGREFQVAGAAQLKDRLPMSVRLNGTSRNVGLTADDRSERVPLATFEIATFTECSTVRHLSRRKLALFG